MVNDLALVDEEFYFISFFNPVRIANGGWEAVIKTVSIKDPCKTLGQNSLDSVHLDDKGGMLPTGTQAKVLACDNEVTRRNHFRETGSLIFENMF